MALEQKLQSWVEAGLIDGQAAARILAHEQADRRPVALWALAGLGMLALVLGVLLLVSANWDRIPDWLKLSVHMALLLAVAAGHWRTRSAGRAWVAETLLFAFAGLVIAGIALQAQVYQQTGPFWHPMMLWLALAGPALLAGGTTRLTGLALSALMLIAPASMFFQTVDQGGAWLLAHGAAIAMPTTLVLLSLVAANGRPPFRLALRQSGLAALLAGASLVHFAWATEISPADARDNALRLLPAALATAAAIFAARKPGADLPRPLLLPLILGPLVVSALALAVPHPDTTPSRLIGVAIFAGFWMLIANGAVRAGLNGLFAVAVAAIGLRIFIIYIELFGSLAATGGGLVLGGALLVGLSWAWHRIVRNRPDTSGPAA